MAKVSLWSALIIVAAVASSQPELPSLAQLAASILLNLAITLAWRRQRRRCAAHSRVCGRDVRNVLIIGTGKSAGKLTAHISNDTAHERMVVKTVDERARGFTDIYPRMDEFVNILRTDFVDEIILAGPHDRDVARQIIQEARRNHIDVKMVPDLLGFEPDPLAFERIGKTTVLTLHDEPLPLFTMSLKRALDLLSAGLALFLTAPLLALVALAIELESPGPVFYRAQRAGLKGRRFLCYKFRTMNQDADKLKEGLRLRNERKGAFFKMTNDPRITRVGRFLRRYSLDELPQLWNIMRGEMSLVGPRPHPIDDFERYQVGDLQRSRYKRFSWEAYRCVASDGAG